MKEKYSVVVAGGGLTGLAAAYSLTRAGIRTALFERDSEVGGLSRTVLHNGFRFDLGGHRFFTKNERVNALVRELMRGELISVQRKSKIYMRGTYFDYPLRPFNALFGLGIPVSVRILADYCAERMKSLVRTPELVSLEDWVISRFGRTMFRIYFKEYSEKVWGLDCSRISVDWVAQRIRGLSLAKAVRNAFFKFSGRDIPSLVDEFEYPALGIGRISNRFREEIERGNPVFTGTGVERIHHSGSRVRSVEVRERGQTRRVETGHFLSSMPLPALVRSLDPPPPQAVLKAAERLRFRDLVVVAVMVDRTRVTDLTWLYLPERKIPFGRIHEPTNWSAEMAPGGKTLLVMEYFSTEGDSLWNERDDTLVRLTVEGLEKQGFIGREEVIDSCVVRAPKAYPLFEVGYADLCKEIYAYLARFDNLHLAGRVGMFRYYNMDHAIDSGLRTAEAVAERLAGESGGAGGEGADEESTEQEEGAAKGLSSGVGSA
ncbi:MAG: FAD-dependent oxidoreductase [Thermodesulfovibrionales bacterium]